MKELLMILEKTIPEVDFVGCKTLVSDGVIDSFDIIEIIAVIEDTYNVQLSGEDIDPYNFESVLRIQKMLEKYR